MPTCMLSHVLTEKKVGFLNMCVTPPNCYIDLTVLLRKRKKPGNCFKKNLLAIAGAINSIHK